MPPSNEYERLAQTIEGALLHAAGVLSQLVHSLCSPTDSQIVMRTAGQLPSVLGSAEEPMTGVLLTLGRDLSGFLVLMLPVHASDMLVDRLVDGSSDEALRSSALGEVGNVVGSAFLNHLADALDLTVMPSPPQVVQDMAGAMLSELAAHLAMHGHLEFPVIQTMLRGVGEGFGAYLLWLPGELQVLGERV